MVVRNDSLYLTYLDNDAIVAATLEPAAKRYVLDLRRTSYVALSATVIYEIVAAPPPKRRRLVEKPLSQPSPAILENTSFGRHEEHAPAGPERRLAAAARERPARGQRSWEPRAHASRGRSEGRIMPDRELVRT